MAVNNNSNNNNDNHNNDNNFGTCLLFEIELSIWSQFGFPCSQFGFSRQKRSRAKKEVVACMGFVNLLMMYRHCWSGTITVRQGCVNKPCRSLFIIVWYTCYDKRLGSLLYEMDVITTIWHIRVNARIASRRASGANRNNRIAPRRIDTNTASLLRAA